MTTETIDKGPADAIEILIDSQSIFCNNDYIPTGRYVIKGDGY